MGLRQLGFEVTRSLREWRYRKVSPKFDNYIRCIFQILRLHRKRSDSLIVLNIKGKKMEFNNCFRKGPSSKYSSSQLRHLQVHTTEMKNKPNTDEPYRDSQLSLKTALFLLPFRRWCESLLEEDHFTQSFLHILNKMLAFDQ